jgi:hypothetical protein
MRDIPLDLQRRFEKRWAARFLRPPNSPQNDRFRAARVPRRGDGLRPSGKYDDAIRRYGARPVIRNGQEDRS